jgi:hypothetical protein
MTEVKTKNKSLLLIIRDRVQLLMRDRPLYNYVPVQDCKSQVPQYTTGTIIYNIII